MVDKSAKTAQVIKPCVSLCGDPQAGNKPWEEGSGRLPWKPSSRDTQEEGPGIGGHGNPQHLDKEAMADAAGLHGVRVHLTDVLLHLQDGAAMQGELAFLLQGQNPVPSTQCHASF